MYLAKIVNEVANREQDFDLHVTQLKITMVQLNIVKTHEDFYRFCREYMPFYFRMKVICSVPSKTLFLLVFSDSLVSKR
jgi:hypothetical protein